jgi:hypothetical protein
VSEPHNHHYVPQFYQRGFLAEGSSKLWIYEKGFPPRHRSTRKTGMVIDLYAFRNEVGATDYSTVENELMRIDDQAAKVIQNLGAEGLLPTRRECGFAPLSRSCFDARQGIVRVCFQVYARILVRPTDESPLIANQNTSKCSPASTCDKINATVFASYH